MNELPALVKGVLADLDGAPVLADWLQEHDREREAALLRKRWKVWKTVRARCVADDAFRAKWAETIIPHARIMEHAATHSRPLGGPTDPAENLAYLFRGAQDDTFADYIRKRFGGVRVEQVRFWLKDANVYHAVASTDGGMSFTACRSLMTGHVVAAGDTLPKPICRKCRDGLTRMTLREPTADTKEAK